MPMSATTISPQSPRPGNSRWPGFLRKNVTVRSAGAAAPKTIPEAPSTPLGMSTAQVGIRRALSDSTSARASPSKGRERPAPKIASITIPAPSRISGENGAKPPVQRSAAWAASPVSFSREPSRASFTGQPAAARCRAATKPSPPFFPGPHSTVTGRIGHRAPIATATALPAASIRPKPSTPLASAAPVGFTHLGGRQQSEFVLLAARGLMFTSAEPQLADSCCFQFLRRSGFRFVIVRLGADEVEDHAARDLAVLEAIENIVDRG